MTYIISEPCIDIKDRSCVDVCPVDCIHEFDRMLIIDPEECIDCGACEPECPVEAIFPEDALPDKWEPFVKINYAFPQGAAVIDPLVQQYADEHNVQNEPLGRSRSRSRCERTGRASEASCDRASGRLQGCAPPQAGISGAIPLLRNRASRANYSRGRGRGQDDPDRRQGPSRLASNVPFSSAARSASPSITA